MKLTQYLLNPKALIMTGVIGSAVALTACATMTGAKPTGNGTPQAVPSVDLNRYMGKWYEVGRLPMVFQRNCASDVTAHYTLKPSGKVEVNNQCMGKDGKPMQSIGEATKNGDTGSKLKVTFLPEALRWMPFGKADYWVLDLDNNYQHALVGTPDNKFLWILSRNPNMDDGTYNRLLSTAKSQGYDLTNFKRTLHTQK